MEQRFVIDAKKTMISCGMLLLLLVTFSNYTVFAVPMRYSLILIAFSGMLFFVKMSRILHKVNYLSLFFLLSFAAVVLNNYELKRGNYIYVVTFFVLLLLVFSCDKLCPYWWPVFYRFLFIFGVIAALVTFICYFIPSVYTGVILPRADAAYYASLLYCFRMGYQAGIAVHYSSNGMFLALFVGVVFSMYLSPKKRNKTASYILLVLFAMVALLLTAKRAHVIFAAAGMLVVYYMDNADRKQTRLFKMVGIVITALVLFIVLGQFIPGISGFIDRFIESQEQGDLLNNRSTLFSYAITLFLQNPFFGTGWGSYKYLRESTYGDYNNAHNVFLQLLAETGIIGAFLFTGLILMLLVMSMKTYNKICKNKKLYSIDEKRICGFAVFMQCFFILYCFTGNPLYDRITWVPVVLSALASRYIGKSKRQTGMMEM